MNPILVVPRPRIPSGNGIRHIQGAVRPAADSGMLFAPAQRALEPVSSMHAVLAAKNDAAPSSLDRIHSRPLPRPPIQPAAIEDVLPPSAVLPRQAADAFETAPAYPIPRRLRNVHAPSQPPPYPIPRRRLDLADSHRQAASVVSQAEDAPSPRAHRLPRRAEVILSDVPVRRRP